MDRILVPLDGSGLSEVIVPAAEALARDYKAEVLLLRALSREGLADEEVAAREEAERYLSGMAEAMSARGLPRVSWRLWYGEPDQAIVNAAAREGVGLVTMSTHGRGGLSRLVLGSVAESVVRKAPVPVLLIRGSLVWVRGRVGKILVPLDGSGRSEAVLPVVERLAGPFDFTVELLHVVEPPPAAALPEISSRLAEMLSLRYAEGEAYLEKVAGPLEARGLRVSPTVREGPAVEVIQEQARGAAVGLIAMSTHGRSGLGRLLLGSVAERVLRTAEVPVLLWKASDAPDTR